MEFLKRVGWLNLLLIFVPISAGLHFTHGNPVTIFVCSCVAIIPLAGLMGKSTEMIAHRLGPGIGGLMNASFGNAAELIIAIVALKEGLIGVVKASITGSILGNVLLVLGLSFLCGGVKHRRQTFNATAAGMSATLLALGAVGLLVPAMFHTHLTVHQLSLEKTLSLEICVVLFGSYLLMLVFSLITHKHLYSAGHGHEAETDDEKSVDFAEVEGLWPQWVSIAVLLAATTGIAVISEFLVHAITETRQSLGWSEIFVGVIIVAVVGNAAEHSTAILVAMKNHMELAYQIAVGSSIQIVLFVAPLLVFISYLPMFHHRLDLVFSTMEVMAVIVSVLIVGLVAYDGVSNWMEGLLLLAVYVILGIAFFHLPEPSASEEQTQILQHAFHNLSC